MASVRYKREKKDIMLRGRCAGEELGWRSWDAYDQNIKKYIVYIFGTFKE